MKKVLFFLFSCMSLISKAQQIETVFEDSVYQLTGVAVSSDGRLFTNYPRWDGPYQYALVEIKNGKKIPFPNKSWNEWNVKKGGNKQKHFIAVQAVVIDKDDNMWVVDPGYRDNLEGEDKGQKLVKINLHTDKVERVYPLSNIAGAKSYLNDIRVDTKKQMGYITNSGDGGIVVVNLKTGDARQVLNGRDVVLSDSTYLFSRHGKALYSHGKPYRANSDGIALSPDGKMLYFKALTDDRLFRIPTSALDDFSMSDDGIYSKVENLGHFITTDGMEFDNNGNLYLGDLENRRLMRVTPDLKMETVIPTNEALLTWPDSYQFTRDGWLYISFSKIDDEPRFHDGIKQPGNYKIIRIKL